MDRVGPFTRAFIFDRPRHSLVHGPNASGDRPGTSGGIPLHIRDRWERAWVKVVSVSHRLVQHQKIHTVPEKAKICRAEAAHPIGWRSGAGRIEMESERRSSHRPRGSYLGCPVIPPFLSFNWKPVRPTANPSIWFGCGFSAGNRP